MIRTRFSAVVLAYLALVLLVGGASAAGYIGNALIQVLGACLIGYCLWHRDPGPAPQPNKTLQLFGMAFVLLAAIQFVPLPPAIWSVLPGRQSVVAGFALLGEPTPWLTVSLAPWSSLASLAWLIPAGAFLLIMMRADRPGGHSIALTIVSVAVASIAIGAIQRSAGAFYFYKITNYGLGTGFFANSNHQASFLLAAIAFWAGHRAAAQTGKAKPDRRQIDQLVYLSVLLLMIFGVILSNSVAGLGLLVGVLIASHLIENPEWRPSRKQAAIALSAVVALVVIVAILPAISDAFELDAGTPGNRRQDYLLTGILAVRDFAPFGSGLGTFERVYHWYEDPTQVGRSYVNHAHNDLLELLIETSLFGACALIAFLRWWLPAARDAWAGRGDGFTKAATLVIAVELLHSLVDYPLRTAAMSSIFAIAMGFMIRPEQTARSRSRSRSRENVPAQASLQRI